jgi:hypothetical protein
MFENKGVKYTKLISIEGEGAICETPVGERVFVMERDKKKHFVKAHNGYAISKDSLEHCASWGVESVIVHETADGEENKLKFDVEEYYMAHEISMFGRPSHIVSQEQKYRSD